MNVQEIIYKTTLDTDEMIFVVQEFIKEKKGVNVDINLLKGLSPQDPFFTLKYSGQLNLLNQAYDKSVSYFMKKLNDNEKETKKTDN